MKIEFNISKVKIAIIVFICLGIFLFALTVPYVINNINDAAFKVKNEPICLTAQDLNRTDIVAGIVLSRFCEGMGLRSSLIWQQAQDGNTYGVPICVK